MIKRIENHAEWISARVSGIGGSDAAAILGKSPFKSNVQLWEEKTGLTKPPDISDNPAVKFGKEAEKNICGLCSR